MSNRTYRVTEIVGTSPDGIDQAIRNGIERASQTLRHLDWWAAASTRGSTSRDTHGRTDSTYPLVADSVPGETWRPANARGER